jgi:16S rRNA processing protein RimM
LNARQTTVDPRLHVRVGRVVKPHGIKGELKILPHGEAEDFRFYREVLLGGEAAGPGRLYRVESFRPQGRMALLQLTGVGDRSAAELLAGQEVWVAREFLAALAADEFYWHEMIGLQVVTESGRNLGRVTALFATGAHDVLVVRGSGREYFIPARREFMLAVDSEAGLLTIAEVPGLLDLND